MKTRNAGFSLVEALVALSISAVVGAAMWAVIQNAVGSSTYFSDRQELDEVMRLTQFALMNQLECHNNIRMAGDTDVPFGQGQRVNIDVVKSRSQGADNILLRSNQDYGRLRIGQITLEESTQNAMIPQQIIYEGGVGIRYNVFFAVLNIPAASRTGRLLDRRQVPLKVFVPALLQPPGTPNQLQVVRKCFVRNVENQTCGSFGGVFNPTTGTCDMPPCDAANVQEACPPNDGWTCSPPVYFWGFLNDPNAPRPPGPRCICYESCQPPAGY